MSTHTVYGCYIASTGKFEFDDTVCTEATITGCLVKEGDHAGQIEITHDYGGCETQYYACYDPATGKFEFEADDGCCGCEECEESEPSLSCCHEEPIPKHMLMTCSDFPSACSGANGSHILECEPSSTYYSWSLSEGSDLYRIMTNNTETVLYVKIGVNDCFNYTYTSIKCACSGSKTSGGYTVSWEPCDAAGNTPCPCDLGECVEATCCGDDCATAPKYLQAVFSGIQNCGDYDCTPGTGCLDAESWNGTWVVEVTSTYIVCDYQQFFADCDCSGAWPPGMSFDQRLYLRLSAAAGGYVQVDAGPVNWPGFSGSKGPLDHDDCEICDNLPYVIDNGTTNCGSVTWPFYGKNGTCTLSKV